MKDKKKSSKTTAAGIVGLIAAILIGVKAGLMGEVVDWNMITVALAVVVPSVGSLFARDHNVSSKSAGVEE